MSGPARRAAPAARRFFSCAECALEGEGKVFEVGLLLDERTIGRGEKDPERLGKAHPSKYLSPNWSQFTALRKASFCSRLWKLTRNQYSESVAS